MRLLRSFPLVWRDVLGLGASRSGSVYVESIIAIVPLLVLILCLTQLILLEVAKLMVEHAAYVGVRAAVVVLDDDPQYYAESPRNLLPERESSESDASEQSFESISELGDTLGGLTSGLAGGAGVFGGSEDDEDTGKDRLAEIRKAAALPLTPLAPDPVYLGASGMLSRVPGLSGPSGGSVSTALGENMRQRIASAVLYYARGALSVRVFGASDGPENLSDFSGEPTISVGLDYLFHCGVPIASALMCQAQGLWSSVAGSGDLASRLKYVESQAVLRTLLATGNHYLVVSGTASLPSQSASYAYESENAEDGSAR